jgi:hypothetical protein
LFSDFIIWRIVKKRKIGKRGTFFYRLVKVKDEIETMCIIRILMISIILILFLPVISQALMESYLPLTSEETGQPFPLNNVETIDSNEWRSFNISAGSSGVYFEGEVNSGVPIVAFGKDKSGFEWRVVISEIAGCMLPVEFYEADLDKNGIKDVVILIPTCGNGLTPSARLIALMFDEQGRPILFEVNGYFSLLEDGIDSLVDMNRDGRAELIHMNYDDGYWITNIYTCQNGRWSRIQGVFAKKRFPLFTRFTNRANRDAVNPMKGRHPFAPNLSNDEPIFDGFLRSFNSNNASGTAVELIIEDSKGQLTKCTPADWYDSARVILDTPTTRQIGLLDRQNDKNASKILNEIITKRIKISLYGKRYSDKCWPETIWATEGKQ